MNNLLGHLHTFLDADLDASAKGFEYLGGTERATTGAFTSTVSFDPRPMLIVTGRVIWTGATADSVGLRLNEERGLLCWHRQWSAEGTALTFTSAATTNTPRLTMGLSTTLNRSFMAVIGNAEGQFHPAFWNVTQATGAAATIGGIFFGSGNWCRTDLITSISLAATNSTSALAADTGFAVFGADA